MAISKLILNGEVQMDVTSNTNTSSNMLSGVVGTKNDGTSVTGNIASKTSTDLTVSGATVTAPAGYYANAASKSVSTTTHPNPTASITSSTGVVTASHTQTAGYVTAGTTTGTLNLTTQAGKTVTPTETAQTAVASYRWTTGTVSVAAISSTYVGTGVATKSSADLTTSGSTVTAPAGYYATAATKSIGAGEAFTPAKTITTNPSFSIVSSTGVVTASYSGSSSITPTVTAGYVSQGTAGTVSTTGTNTYQLTSKAAATYNTSTTDQTVASYRWLTGTQTIKSVTTSNLTAENIAEGVIVKVGDANNASRITQITGTHSGATSYTATISGSGNSSYCYVTYNGTKYYTNGNTFTYKAGDTLTIYCRGNSLTINGNTTTLSSYSYTYTLPTGNITIALTYSSSTSNNIKIWGLVQPTGTYSVSAAGNHNVYNYSVASVPTGSAFPPAVTITTNPSFTLVSSTGKITAAYTGSSSVTPTVTAGWVTTGTAGTISTTGTSTYTLTTQAAQTFYPSTADQTVASYRWLTGTQTIKSVTTSNLTAANVADGVVVKVGDSANASRITQVTGTHKGGTPHTARISGSGNVSYCYVQYNSTKYYTNNSTFTFYDGDTLTIYAKGSSTGAVFIIGDSTRTETSGTTAIGTTYTMPGTDINIELWYSAHSGIQITLADYSLQDVGDMGYIEPSSEEQYFGVDSSHYGFTGFTVGAVTPTNIVPLTVSPSPSQQVINAGSMSTTLVNLPRTSLNDSMIVSSMIRVPITFSGIPSYGSTINISSFTVAYSTDYTDYQVNFDSCSKTFNGFPIECTKSYYTVYIYETYIQIYEQVIDHIYEQYSYITPVEITGTIDVDGYAPITVNASGNGFTADQIATHNISGSISGNATAISNYAFAYCVSITAASFSQCTTIYESAFLFCSGLTTVSFPNCQSILTSGLYGCSSLTAVDFPNCLRITSGAFGYCTKLTTASFSKCTTISGSAFRSCYNLLSLYLLGSSIPTLANINAFNSTPISTYTTSTGGVYGSIFVPSSLYNSYLTATNWSLYSARIVSV